MREKLNLAAVGIVCATITYFSVYQSFSLVGYTGSSYILHGLAYFGLAAVLLMHFHPTKHGIMESIILASAAGIGIELIQSALSYRTFSFLDIMVNTFGASLVVFDYHGFAVDKIVALEDKALDQIKDLNKVVPV